MKAVLAAKPEQAVKSVQRLLHEALRFVQEERDPAKLHASDLTRMEKNRNFCPREAALKIALGVRRPSETIITSKAMTFALGRLVEDKVRGLFADMGLLVGDWECVQCGTRYRMMKRPPQCTACGAYTLRYVEPRAVSALTGISCGIDILLNRDGKRLDIVELKTMDKEAFADLKAPLVEHRLRTQLYLRCAAEDPALKDRVNTDRASLLYVTKGGWGVKTGADENWPFKDGGFSPFREYPIARDDAAVEPFAEFGRQVMRYLADGTVPKRVENCVSPGCARAGECPVAQHCWKAGDAW